MALDNVTFLIMWFMVMFVTLSSGILVIMYRVGCFKCDKKIGIAEIQTSLEKLIRPHGTDQAQQQNAAEQGAASETAEAAAARISITPRGGRSGGDPVGLEMSPATSGQGQLRRQQTDRSDGSGGRGGSAGPVKLCTVCNEPLGPDEDTSDNSHPSCRDMDASFF